MRIRTIALALAAVLTASAGAFAQEPALVVTDGRQSVEIEAATLAEMKQETIETTTAWTEGKTIFAGPSFNDVLNEAGLNGETVAAEARDGYRTEIPRERLTADGAILATSMNGEKLPADKAPYWIVFPYDSAPEMNDEAHQSWSAWAVTKLTIE